MTRVQTVILAGGKVSDEIKSLTGVDNRALVPIGGRPMLDYVVDALASAKSVEGIVVVGDVPASGRYRGVPDQGSLFDNLVAGLKASGSEYVLVSTSDIPFLTAEAVDDFVERASGRAVDIAYPIVEMSAYRRRFGGMKRTTVKLSEGEFTGGNMMLVRTEFVVGQPERIQQAYAARKDVLKLGMMLGGDVLFRLIVSQTVAPSMLTLPIVEAAAARVLGGGSTSTSPTPSSRGEVKVAAIVTSFPEIGTDVDKPEDIAAAEKLLSTARATR